MAYVAFDLDRTLGFFECVAPLGFLWSKDFLENPEQGKHNGAVNISSKLETALRRVRETFARLLLADPTILYTVLRPNLDTLILPLLKAKKEGNLKSVIIYSNTGVSYTVELARFLIESHYKSFGLFSLVADNWHPLRTGDIVGPFEEKKKTIGTLQKLFKRSTHSRDEIPLSKILFVDDREPKHELEAQIEDGLTYIQPVAFAPSITEKQKHHIVFLALYALEKHGIFRSREYLQSGFCYRNIPYDYTKKYAIRGFTELVDYILYAMEDVNPVPTDWRRDTAAIERRMTAFLQQAKGNAKVSNKAK